MKATPERLAALERVAEAAKKVNTQKGIDLGDLIYRVRENEGKGWEGPLVKRWSNAVAELEASLRALDGAP